MIKRIGEWRYALKVCKKYGAKWDIFCNMSCARYTIGWNRWGICKQVISINPFYEGFLDSFLHEVGHLAWYKRIYNQSDSIQIFEQKMEEKDILYIEYVAWRFAKLCRKNQFNKKRARWMFSTYFRSFAKEVGAVQAADVYYGYDRRIEK